MFCVCVHHPSPSDGTAGKVQTPIPPAAHDAGGAGAHEPHLQSTQNKKGGLSWASKASSSTCDNNISDERDAKRGEGGRKGGGWRRGVDGRHKQTSMTVRERICRRYRYIFWKLKGRVGTCPRAKRIFAAMPAQPFSHNLPLMGPSMQGRHQFRP
jgi:hypothetical protein